MRINGFALVGLAGLACAEACVRRPAPPDTLVVLNDRDIEGLDPHTSGEVWHTQTVLGNVYEPLVTFDPRMALVPGLAVSWLNPDELTWEFRIRPGVPLHDGGTLTAEDVVFSLTRARDDPHSVLRGALGAVVEIQAAGPGVVRLRTREPDAFLISRLREVFIASKTCVETHGVDALQFASCGTGPYRVAARTPGRFVDLQRFDAYWGGPAPIPKLRFVARSWGQPDALGFVPPTGRLLFWAPAGTELFRTAQARFDFAESPGPTVTYLSFDLRGGTTPGVRLPSGRPGNPFRDPRVREAVALALDPKKPLGIELGFPASQPVPPNVFGFDPLVTAVPRDLERARRLLRETPFGDGFDVDLDVRKIMERYAAPVAEDLLALGIRCHVKVLPEKDFFEKTEGGRSSLYILRFTCRTGDAQEFLDKWVHSRDIARGLGEVNQSYDEGPVPGLDALIDAARREIDPTVRRDKLQSVIRRVAQAHLLLPLIHNKFHRFVSKDVDWKPRADTLLLFYDARFRPV